MSPMSNLLFPGSNLKNKIGILSIQFEAPKPVVLIKLICGAALSGKSATISFFLYPYDPASGIIPVSHVEPILSNDGMTRSAMVVIQEPTTLGDSAPSASSVDGHADRWRMITKMNGELERNLGEQPIAQIMVNNGLKAKDLVAISTEQITHKMVSRARKGRRLTPNVQSKVRNALNKSTGKKYSVEELFTY